MTLRKVALVTGASGGFGAEFARLLAEDGYDLVLVARSEDKMRALAGELARANGVDVRVIAQDLAELDAPAKIFALVPRCDVLVNNAGFATNGRFDEMDEARLREEILLDVLALTELTRKYLPSMRAAKSGRILNVASTAGFAPGPFASVYYAAKAYVVSFTEAIAEEAAGSGVTVTCFAPGATSGTGFANRSGMQTSLLFTVPIPEAKSIVRAGYRGMMRGQRLVVPGIANKLAVMAPRIFPRRMITRVSRRLNEAR